MVGVSYDNDSADERRRGGAMGVWRRTVSDLETEGSVEVMSGRSGVGWRNVDGVNGRTSKTCSDELILICSSASGAGCSERCSRELEVGTADTVDRRENTLPRGSNPDSIRYGIKL